MAGFTESDDTVLSYRLVVIISPVLYKRCVQIRTTMRRRVELQPAFNTSVRHAAYRP